MCGQISCGGMVNLLHSLINATTVLTQHWCCWMFGRNYFFIFEATHIVCCNGINMPVVWNKGVAQVARCISDYWSCFPLLLIPTYRLEWATYSSILTPVFRSERWHRAGNRTDSASKLRPASWCGYDIRQSSHRTGGQDERDEYGQDWTWVFEVYHPVQPE